jgi:capsular polysaccharide biosynthesis protein
MPRKVEKTPISKDQPRQHLMYMWVLITVLAALAIVGWSVYFLRSAKYQSDLQKLQNERNQAIQRLQQYEDVQSEDLFNDYQ